MSAASSCKKRKLSEISVPVAFKKRQTSTSSAAVAVRVDAPQQHLEPANTFGVRLVSPFQLYPYQQQAVRWLLEVERGLHRTRFHKPGINGGMLAMVMGLGKTLCVGTVIMHTLREQRLASQCTLYVCPKTLMGTVRSELHKFFGDQLRVLVYHRDFGRTAVRDANFRDVDVVVTNYGSVVSKFVSAGKAKNDPQARTFCAFPWYRIVLDESHEIRESYTRKFKAVNALSSVRRICMTGTPIHNRVQDIVNQMVFTGVVAPQQRRRDTSGKARNSNNGTSLFQDLELDRTVRFVELKDAENVRLPEKQVETIFFRLSQEEQAVYDYYARQARSWVQTAQDQQGRQKTLHSMRARACLTQVLQVCSAAFLVTPTASGGQEAPPFFLAPNDRARSWMTDRGGSAGLGSSKLRRFVQLMQTLAAEGEKVVVFANYTGTLRLAADSLPGGLQHVLIHGKMSSRAREAGFASFREDPKVQVLLMTLKLGSVGLNLTEARTVVFLEPWYAYSALYQAEGRVHRIGQRRPVRVYYLLAEHTAEKRVYDIAMRKKTLASEVCQQAEGVVGLTDMADILLEDVAVNNSMEWNDTH
jgi:transcription termination factor 2